MFKKRKHNQGGSRLLTWGPQKAKVLGKDDANEAESTLHQSPKVARGKSKSFLFGRDFTLRNINQKRGSNREKTWNVKALKRRTREFRRE